jgi:hypothetical protein
VKQNNTVTVLPEFPASVLLPLFLTATTTIYENSEPNQEVDTYTVKAVATREEAEKLVALGYEFHYRTRDGVDLFRKKVTGLD